MGGKRSNPVGDVMKQELIYQSIEKSTTWDIINAVETVEYDTQRSGSPGTLTFTAHLSGDLSFAPGDPVRFLVDGTIIFSGWVFTASYDRWGSVDVTAYDQLRYLKASASYAFYDMTAGQIIQQIAADFNLTVSTIEDTGYSIPSLIMEEKTCLDIVSEAVQQTLLNTATMYIFFDDGVGLSLRQAANMISDTAIGENSLLGEYTYKRDIDSQTYNSVKLARPNEETGRADVFIAQDSANIAKWGFLQYYATVDEALNDAQVGEQATQTLVYYNRELKSLSLSSLGVSGLRAGQMLLVVLTNGPGINAQQLVLLESVRHTWEQGVHTMEIETLNL